MKPSCSPPSAISVIRFALQKDRVSANQRYEK